MWYANMQYCPYGRSISRLAKQVARNHIEELVVYNVNKSIVTGNMEQYAARYRAKKAKKNLI